jgi:hypothetical protein
LKMGTKLPLFDATLLVAVKNNTVFMHCCTDRLPLSAIVCKVVHEQEQRATNALRKSKN